MLTFDAYSVPNVLSTVPPGSIENTHGNGGNAQGLESPIMVTDFSVTQMVGNFLEHDQRRQDSWLASSGRGSCQEVRFEIYKTQLLVELSLPSMVHLQSLSYIISNQSPPITIFK